MSSPKIARKRMHFLTNLTEREIFHYSPREKELLLKRVNFAIKISLKESNFVT